MVFKSAVARADEYKCPASANASTLPAMPGTGININKSLSLSTIEKEMTRQAIIERTIKALNQLPEEKAKEISDFADFVTKRHEEQILTQDIQQLMSTNNAFDFLDDEEDLYSETDLEEVYNG